jgi:molybdopterin molybdotransferase
MTSVLPGYEEAAALVADCARKLLRLRPPAERLPLTQASGRVLAQPVVADRDQPPFARSTRDGYACRAAEANNRKPLIISGATRAGDAPSGPLPPGSVWEIMNGAPLPSGADAVMAFQDVSAASGKKVRLLSARAIKPGQNAVAQGAHARAAEELLPTGTALLVRQIALAAACGYAEFEVFRRPRVAILATGDELVPASTAPAPGQIRNSNGPMLAALVAAAGGEPWMLPIAADNADALHKALTGAADADLLLISGGVSVGKFDLVEPALARLGARFHFTGVRIQPGKPAVFGELKRGEKQIGPQQPTLPFFALPGNPVATAVAFQLFAAPLLAALAGSRQSLPRFALARLSESCDQKGKPGLTRFLPAFCDFTAKPPRAALIPTHGSGDLTALARSNCFLILPEDARRQKSGALTNILLL